nr:CocE/NonD family hydrolase [uncultured Porphyromonas sp.]
MKRKSILALLGAACMVSAQAKPQAPLKFDASKSAKSSLTMPDGRIVHYTAYTNQYFVSQVEDSTYQYLNVFVPEGATEQTPIFVRTYIGGYMESAAGYPQATDASGRALAEGYVLVIPGSRGRRSTVKQGKQTLYTGRAPKGLLDLKAAVRYLRHFDRELPGDTEKIIIDGTSAGGAMSALVGATGNHPAYAPLLKAMGVADERDDVFASVCFCPITDLEHADMAYEWLYGRTASRQALPEAQRQLVEELAAQYPAYLNSLGLARPDGRALTADNYRDYIKELLIESAQAAKDAGASIADTLGFSFSAQAAFQAPINGGVGQPPAPAGLPSAPRGMRRGAPQQGEYITGLDLEKYLNYVVTTQPLKGVPAFDSYQVDGAEASGENGLFGDARGSDANFTPWAAGKTGAKLSAELLERVRLMNPMGFIGDAQATNAPYWYLRHGARDRDTAFSIVINLAAQLRKHGRAVDFKLPWNRPHSGDYALNELFAWLKAITR